MSIFAFHFLQFVSFTCIELLFFFRSAVQQFNDGEENWKTLDNQIVENLMVLYLYPFI